MLNYFVFFPHGATFPVGYSLSIIESSRLHSDTSHPVGLLWKSDRLVAETSTSQHTTLTRDITSFHIFLYFFFTKRHDGPLGPKHVAYWKRNSFPRHRIHVWRWFFLIDKDSAECWILYLYAGSRCATNLQYHATHVQCSVCIWLLGTETFLRSHQPLSYTTYSPHFMELEGSIQHSQLPAICPYPEPDQSSQCPLHDPTSWRSILILSSHLCPGLPSGLFYSGFPTKTLFTPPLSLAFSHKCYMNRPSHSSQFDHPNNICWAVQIIKLLIT